MENQKIQEIIGKIRDLENELEEEIQKRRDDLFCEFGKKRAIFKEEVLAEHRKNVERLLHYFATTPILHIVTAPIIWMALFPAILLDLFVSVYQAICFPVYKISKVKRNDYIVIDRHRLAYLNIVEKINCVYCGYFNGLIGYVGEIAARTEQYWCPIKHAEKIKGIHFRYQNFFDYGDSVRFRAESANLRSELETKE